MHVKNTIIIIIVSFIIGFGVSSYIFYRTNLSNDRITKERIAAINKQFAEYVESTNRTVESLRKSEQDKQSTIDRFTENQRRSENTIRELTKLAQQRQDIIDRLTAEIGQDSTDLQRLREIIEGLSKAK